jgi:hypothetical protein
MYKKLNIALLAIFTAFAISANAEPMAYSVSSDSGNPASEDSLYSIDLATGANQMIGRLISSTQTRLDTEGLAFAPDGTLWGVDDDSLTLFPINLATGSVKFQEEIPLPGFSTGGGNDFGMTFSCDNSLYVTSVRTQTLYQIGLEGSNQVIGSQGALKQNISAIAAIGNPTRLYGLGNGQFANGSTDSPNLYSIDPETGIATLIGPLGPAVGDYNQGGLSFDANGDLWAITDRRLINNTIADLPSQILKIDITTGQATLVSATTEVGFESLAVAPPAMCVTAPPPVDPPPPTGERSEFPVIPTLSGPGRLLTILILLLVGTIVLRKRA